MKEPSKEDIATVTRIMARERTDLFTETEMRLMIGAFRNKNAEPGVLRALLSEFEQALDKRIKLKLGLIEAPDTKRDPTE